MDKQRVAYAIIGSVLIIIALYIATVCTSCATRWTRYDFDRLLVCNNMMQSYQRGIENAMRANDFERVIWEAAFFVKTWREQGCEVLVDKVTGDAP